MASRENKKRKKGDEMRQMETSTREKEVVEKKG